MAKESSRSFLFLNGINSYITLPTNSLPIGSEFTVSFWSYGGDALPTHTTIISAVDVHGNRMLNVHMPWIDSKIYFDCGNSEKRFDRIERSADSLLFKGKWSHWAFTKNATTGEMKIYHNGEIWFISEGKTLMLPQAAEVRVGNCINNSFNHQFYYQGSITELKIWNIARGENDIKKDMNDQLSGDEEGLVSYWPLDEQEGNTIYDKTKNCETGIIHGSANWIELEKFPPETGHKRKSTQQRKSTQPIQEPEELLNSFPQKALYLMIGGVALVAEEVSKTLENFTDISEEIAQKMIEKGQEVYNSSDSEK